MKCSICGQECFSGGISHECDLEEHFYKLKQELCKLKRELQDTVYQGKRWEQFSYWLAGEDYEQAWGEFMRTIDIESDNR